MYHTTHRTIGGGSNCNWYELLSVSPVDYPVDVDRALPKPRTVFTTSSGWWYLSSISIYTNKCNVHIGVVVLPIWNSEVH